MTVELKHRIRLVLGDPSGDGHGRTWQQIISSNLTGQEINEAYKLGTKRLGFDFIANVCSDYCCSRVSVVEAEELKALGCTIFDEDEYGFDEEKGYSIDRHEYVSLYLFLCKLGNTEFKYEYVSNTMDTLNIGGYGLFG